MQMSFLRLSATLVISMLLCFWCSQAIAQPPEFCKIQIEGEKTFHYCQLSSRTEDRVELFEISTNRHVTVSDAQITSLVEGISSEEVVANIGLPKFVAWQLGTFRSKRQAVGNVIKTAGPVVYLTLNADNALRIGDEITVYRVKDEIVDPVTSKVLGVERPRIAVLEIVEVQAGYSKAKLKGNLEVQVMEKDEVQISKPLKVVVLPIFDENGTLTTVGETLSNEIINELVSANVDVVSREALRDILSELVIQNTELFDASTAVKIGGMVGANVAINGKIIPKRATGQAFIQIVDIGSTELVYATKGTVNTRLATPVRSPLSGSVPSNVDEDMPTSPLVFRGTFVDGVVKTSSSLQFNNKIGSNYSVTVRYEKQGTDAVIALLPVTSHNVQLVIDQEYGSLSGLSNLDGKDASRNETRSGITSRPGENVLTISVRSAGSKVAIRATLNGGSLVSWSGDPARLSTIAPWVCPDRTKFGLATADVSVKLIDVKIE